MKESKEMIIEKKKSPRCVTIYNRLFSMIEAGEFSLEGKLPTEPKLAEQMGVSRTTLRQALYLLQEDGIIKNIQGKGNFIIGAVQKWEKGLENLENPVYFALNMLVEEMEIEFRLEAGAEYSNKVLERKSSVVLYADIWYKTQGKGVAYTLSILPIETILEEKIDLSDEKQLLKYLTEGIYQKVKRSELHLLQATLDNFYEMKYELCKEREIHLLQEALYTKNKYPIAYQKHYIPVEHSHISIIRSK